MTAELGAGKCIWQRVKALFANDDFCFRLYLKLDTVMSTNTYLFQ